MSLSRTLIATTLAVVAAATADAFPCVTNDLGGAELLSTLVSSGWGLDVRNTRYQPPEKAGLAKAELSRLTLSWSYGVPNARAVRSQPVVTERALFMGTQQGAVVAIDRESGCEYWTFDARSQVRTALSLGPSADGARALLYFGDFGATIYALDAATGELVWKQGAARFFAATSTGSPTLYGGRLYVPVSSLEVGVAVLPFYPCCLFQGKVVAMDAYTGAVLWSRSVIDEPPRALRNDPAAPRRFGPSGAPIWSSPTVDARRNRLYVGTGQGYVQPVPARSDAIVALDLDSGEILWSRQMLDDDAWNAACILDTRNCPSPEGPDFDFGAPPVLLTLEDGTDRLYVAQKSADVYALDPDRDGAIVWHRKVGLGGGWGGVHFGMATDGVRLYVPNSDALPGISRDLEPGEEPRPSVVALDPWTGDTLWEARPVVPCHSGEECVPAFSAAAMAGEGYVLAADLEGYLWAFDSETGAVLWSVSTLGSYEGVNGIAARGGSIDASGPLVAGGAIYVGSGYGFFGKMRGNVLLSFRAP